MRSRTRDRGPAGRSNRGNRPQSRSGPAGANRNKAKSKGNQPKRGKSGAGKSGAGKDGSGKSGAHRGGQNKAANQRNRNRRPNKSSAGVTFWGDPANLPAPSADVRMTDAPSAVPRSLGPAPLPGHEAIAEHYFSAVYDRAVATAGALAAAGGLIDPLTLVDDND